MSATEKVLGEIGETRDAVGNLLEPHVAYRLDGDGGFVRVAAAVSA